VDLGVRVVHVRQAECALHGLKQLEIDAGFRTDLTRRHVYAVVAHDPARGQQHRGELAPDLFDAEAPAE
jgi:hypothetical protein